MRRLATLVVTAGLLFSASPAPARAQPSPSPGAAATPAETVCEFDAGVELSGLVATGSGYVAVNDSNDDPAAIRVFFYDRACRLTRTVGYPTTARDPEDLAVAPDGTLSVADIGDNLTNADRRRTVALWKLPPGARTPVIHRLTYPDGPHDAEALVLDGTGTPVIVTKEPFGTAGVYTPTGPLQPDTAIGVPLRRVGTFTPQRTGTPNFLGSVGEVMVTGGANAPDGRRVALRTYADAYEWDVPDGDVVKAITTGTPRVTPLPEEPQGESIAYSRDGTSLLTVSDQPGPAPLLRYRATRPGPTPGPAATGAAAATRAGAAAPAQSPAPARYLVGAAGVLGFALVATGVAIGRSRRSRRGGASM